MPLNSLAVIVPVVTLEEEHDDDDGLEAEDIATGRASGSRPRIAFTRAI